MASGEGLCSIICFNYLNNLDLAIRPRHTCSSGHTSIYIQLGARFKNHISITFAEVSRSIDNLTKYSYIMFFTYFEQLINNAATWHRSKYCAS